MSQMSSTSKRGIDKHCNEEGCNGKKITAKHWSEHKKAFQHKEEDKEDKKDGV